MSDAKQYRGLAFQVPSGAEPQVNPTTPYNEGMSLRQWYAGLAMQGMCTPSWPGKDSYEEMAKRAFWMADAMIAEGKQ